MQVPKGCSGISPYSAIRVPCKHMQAVYATRHLTGTRAGRAAKNSPRYRGFSVSSSSSDWSTNDDLAKVGGGVGNLERGRYVKLVRSYS